MKLVLRTAACCAAILGVLGPNSALGDEAALKRTAPDKCIAWFSWAGFDALAKTDAKTNRTEMLLADEEVRAFLDSIAKSIGSGIKVQDDETTKQMAQVARVLAARPSVAYLTKISEVKRESPRTAAIIPANKVTVGADGLERIGVDFDFDLEAPAATPQLHVHILPEVHVHVAPVGRPRIGRTRTVEENGKNRREIELIWPNAKEWREFVIDAEFVSDGTLQPGSDRPVTKADLEKLVAALSDGERPAAVREWKRVRAETPAEKAPAVKPSPSAVDIKEFTRAVETGIVGGQPRSSAWIPANEKPAAATAAAPPKATPSGLSTPVAPSPSSPEWADGTWWCKDGSCHGPAAAPGCTTCRVCDVTTTTTVIHGAAVVDLGEHAGEMRALFEKLAAAETEAKKETICGVEFLRVETTQPAWLAISDTYFIFACDETSARIVVDGLAGKREIPNWLTDAEKKLPIERPAVRVHVTFDTIDEPIEAEAREFLKLLGLDQVSAISCVAGLDDIGTAVKTLITTRDGADASLVLDIFGDKGLTAEDLKTIPKDATMAAAGKIDAKKLIDLGFGFAKLTDKENKSSWDAAKDYLARNLFIDLSKDIVEAIGDTWTLHYAPSEGGLMATTFTLGVRDEARLKGALEKLALVAIASDIQVRRFTYRGQEVYYFSGEDGAGGAAWCIRDGRLVATMLPQTIKARIARGPLKESLADVPGLANILDPGKGEPKNGPLLLTYTDTRDILRWCYQYGSFLLPTIGYAISESEEIGFALHEIPSLAVIEQYFDPSITTISRTDSGLLIDSRQTVPMISGLVTLSAMASVGGLSAFEPEVLDVSEMADSLVNPMKAAMWASGIGGPCEGCASGHCLPPAMPLEAAPSASYPLPPAYPPGQPVPYPAPLPYGTPVPYHAAPVVGQPYVPPPTSAPNRPANYESPRQGTMPPPTTTPPRQGTKPTPPTMPPKQRPGVSYPAPKDWQPVVNVRTDEAELPDAPAWSSSSPNAAPTPEATKSAEKPKAAAEVERSPRPQRKLFRRRS